MGGYLAPISKGEELLVLWKGDEADENFSRWAYARRVGPPHDEGWVLKDVVHDPKPGVREQDQRGHEGTPGSTVAPALVPGGVAYHLRSHGLGSRLHLSPGPGGIAAARCDGKGTSSEEGGAVLEHNEMVRVDEVQGAWARVSTASGASGWVRTTYLRHAPVPAGPPPTSSRATSRASSASTTHRRRVTFDEEEVESVSP